MSAPYLYRPKNELLRFQAIYGDAEFSKDSLNSLPETTSFKRAIRKVDKQFLTSSTP